MKNAPTTLNHKLIEIRNREAFLERIRKANYTINARGDIRYIPLGIFVGEIKGNDLIVFDMKVELTKIAKEYSLTPKEPVSDTTNELGTEPDFTSLQKEVYNMYMHPDADDSRVRLCRIVEKEGFVVPVSKIHDLIARAYRDYPGEEWNI